MERDQSPTSRERELRSRIDWLSGLIDQTLPAGGPSIESVETGGNLRLQLQTQSLESPVANIITESLNFHVPNGSLNSDEVNTGKAISVSGGRKCLQAYFRHVHRAYPFIDSEIALHDYEKLCQECALDGYLDRSVISSRLHMIIAIGFTTLQRAGDLQDVGEKAFEPSLQDVLCECLRHINEESAGTLLLLGLYLLFKPSDLDPRAIVGIIARHALAIGLFAEPPNAEDTLPRALEFRRRLSWSIYVFDRMISISYGLPFGFTNETMQVPLPSIMIHEYASEEGHQYTIALQVSRHVISLRQLETRIVNSIYNKSSSLPSQELRRQIEDWYTQGCLLSSSALWEQDQLPFHTTITWLNVRYQNLILLLYTPAHGDAAAEDNLPKLQAAAQQYVQLSLILHEHRHLPMNWVTLCRLLSLSAIFLYCIGRWSSALGEIPEIGLLASLLELFPPSWEAAHEASKIVRRLTDAIAAQKNPLVSLGHGQSPDSAVLSSASIDIGLELQNIKKDLVEVLRKALGDASFYIWPLRSKVVERMIPQQFITGNSLHNVFSSGLPGSNLNVPNHNTVTPDHGEILANNPLDTQWVNLLGGLGSDML